MDFASREDKARRSQVQMTSFGRVFSRTYTLPEDYILASMPAKGAIQPGYGTEAYETETKDCLKPRVANIQWLKQQSGGTKSVTITFVKADSY